MSTELRNVLVIGLGLSGAPAANALAKTLPENHRIIAISATSSAYYSVAALRSIVVEDWQDKSTLPLDTFFPKGSRHVVLPGTKVVQLLPDLHTVRVDKEHPEFGFGLEITFDYAIIATGSNYAFPCRPPTQDSSIDGVRKLFRATQEAIKASSSILIVGGGPVGIEFAGEVKAAYPQGKEVTLVHAGKALMEGEGYKESLGRSLLDQLRARGVHVVFNKRLDTHGLETGKIEPEEFDLGGEEGSVKGECSLHERGGACLVFRN